MQIVAPVTDYIPASILTTLGDIPIRGAAIPERLQEAGFRGFRVGYFQLNATANYETPALGFTPQKVILFAIGSVEVNEAFSVGFDDGANDLCIYYRDGGTLISRTTTASFYIRYDAGNHLSGRVNEMRADTVFFEGVLVGVCTAQIHYLILP